MQSSLVHGLGRTGGWLGLYSVGLEGCQAVYQGSSTLLLQLGIPAPLNQLHRTEYKNRR